VSPGSALQTGQSATVNWTVQNSVNAETDGSFSERVTIRNTGNSQVVSDTVQAYDQSVSGAIGAGQTRSRQVSITLPNGSAAAGSLEVTVTTDTLNNVAEQNSGGTAEANNARSITIVTTLAPYPDLQVASL